MQDSNGDMKKLEAEEKAEHPKLSKKQIHQIVIDHLKRHISELDEGPEEEKSEEDGPRMDTVNRFKKMSRAKADLEAEKAGEYD